MQKIIDNQHSLKFPPVML